MDAQALRCRDLPLEVVADHPGVGRGRGQRLQRMAIRALVRLADRRQGMAAQPEDPAMVGQGGDLEAQRRPGQGGHVDFAAQYRGGDRHVDSGVEVLAAAFEPKVGQEADGRRHGRLAARRHLPRRGSPEPALARRALRRAGVDA
jgi:hypothetical protein